MARYCIGGNALTAIADAVRAKTGSSDPMTPSEMAEALNNLTLTTPEPEVTVSQQSANGITTYVYQWDRIVIIYWDGAPSSAMAVETWHTIATGLPASAMTMMQPVYTSCFNWQEYSARLDDDLALSIYPRGGAITGSDKIRGQLVYIAAEEAANA